MGWSKMIRNWAAYSDGDAIVGEDEGGVDAGELGVGHLGLGLSQVAEKTRL